MQHTGKLGGIVAATCSIALGCVTPDPRPPPAQTVDVAPPGSAAPEKDVAANQRQLAELTRRVEAIEKSVPQREKRSREMLEYDRLGMEAFWQVRFDKESIDRPWGSFVEKAIGGVVAGDPAVVMRSLECHSTLCRLEVTCLRGDDCSPRWTPPGMPPNPNLGAQYCAPRRNPSGKPVKVLFLFREGRSMVPREDP